MIALAHVLPIVLTSLALCALHVHTVYRVPGGLVVTVLPWLGVALATVTPLMVMNRLVGGTQPGILSRVARGTLALSVILAGLGVAAPASPLTWALTPLLFGLALSAASVLVVVLAGDLLSTVGSPVVARALAWAERAAWLVITLFVVTAAFAFANGVGDPGPIEAVRAEMRDTGGVSVDVGQVIAMGWGDVRRATPADRTDRILLTLTERHASFPGQAIVLRMRPGRLGLPWVEQIVRDEEALARRTLAVAPNARIPRRALVLAALERRDWPAASTLAADYFDRFQSLQDARVVFTAANQLGMARQYAAALALIEPLATRHPTGEILGLAGFINHEMNKLERARELLEVAVIKDPGGWLNHYRLGIVYQSLRRFDDSIAALEKATTLWPDLPEIRTRLETVKRAKARSTPVE